MAKTRERSEALRKSERILGRIKDISDVLAKVAQGDFSSYCKLTGDKTLDIIVIGINRMVSDLKEKSARLEEVKTILEIKVNARTRELRELAEGLEKKVKERTKELEDSRAAAMNMLEDINEARAATVNILEDVDEARVLAESERDKTRAIITNFTDGLLVFDAGNKLSLFNPRAENFFGIKGGGLTGKSVSELKIFPAIKPLVILFGEEIKTVPRKEIQIKENLILEVSTVAMSERERNLGILVILHDITREKTIEKLKTEFVSLSAHQLRTPLSAVKWTLRMLLDGDLGEINKEQREFIEKTYASNEKMINLINDLLNITRIEEGKYLYKLTPIHLEDMVQSVINSLGEATKKRKLLLEFKKPEEALPEVEVDAEKIQLAISNLIDNAIRYTLPGGKVTVSLKNAKNKIEFSVRDTGVGIPKSQQERITTKFFRGANVMRMETEGTGLGLYITRNIIEAHGGKLWFESEENKGTTFYFSLPLKGEGGELEKP